MIKHLIHKYYEALVIIFLLAFMLCFHLGIKAYLNSPATEENKKYALKYCPTIEKYYPNIKDNTLTKGDVRLASIKCNKAKENKKV